MFLFAAWPLFRASLREWARGKGTLRSLIAWLRVFEWVPGKDDGLGHPHFHIWILSPYLDQDKLTHWWRCALRTSGVKPEIANQAHIDVGETTTRDGAAREVIKYLTKDILPSGELVSPKIFAEVYVALDGRRISQPSAGFFKGIDRVAECSCGAIGCSRRTLRPPAVGPDGIVTDEALKRLTRGSRKEDNE